MLAARLPALRRGVADALIARVARQNAAIAAAVFIPGVDFPVLTLNQLRLVLRIARGPTARRSTPSGSRRSSAWSARRSAFEHSRVRRSA